MPSESIASSVSSTVLPFSSASISTRVTRVSTRLTTKPGASATSTPRFLSFLTTSHAVASYLVGRLRRAHDLDERHQRDRVEEVQADVGAHLLDGERRRVRREDRVRARPRAPRRRPPASRRAPRRPPRARGRSPRTAPSRCRRRRASRGTASSRRPPRGSSASASSTRACSMSRSTTGTSSRRRKSVASCVAISPAPTMPTFCTRRGFASGSSGGRLRAPLDDGERVRGRLRLRADEQLGHRVLLGRVALFERPVLRARDQVERDVRRARRAVHRVVDARARLAQHGVELRPVGRTARSISPSSRANCSDSSTNSTGSSSRSAIPSSNASGAVSSLFWRSGFSDDHLRRGLGADQLRQRAACRPRRG